MFLAFPGHPGFASPGAYHPWMSPPSSRSGRVLGYIAVGLLFLCTILLSCTPMRTADIWWHLRTGELILERGALPRTDWFTFADADVVDIRPGLAVLDRDANLGVRGQFNLRSPFAERKDGDGGVRAEADLVFLVGDADLDERLARVREGQLRRVEDGQAVLARELYALCAGLHGAADQRCEDGEDCRYARHIGKVGGGVEDGAAPRSAVWRRGTPYSDAGWPRKKPAAGRGVPRARRPIDRAETPVAGITFSSTPRHSRWAGQRGGQVPLANSVAVPVRPLSAHARSAVVRLTLAVQAAAS